MWEWIVNTQRNFDCWGGWDKGALCHPCSFPHNRIYIPNKSFFRYLQIRHALGEQFRERTLEWSKISLLQKVINATTSKGLISSLYPHIYKGSLEGIEAPSSRRRWEQDVGTITASQWSRILDRWSHSSPPRGCLICSCYTELTIPPKSFFCLAVE